MPKLVEGPSPPTTKFAVSLPHSLPSASSLMCASDDYDGLGEWLTQASVTLPNDLYTELCTLFRCPGQNQLFRTGDTPRKCSQILSCEQGDPTPPG
jgi:hypothetical protein